MEGLFFNIDSGFIEGVVRGYRNGFLTSAQYGNLTQCDTLEDLKLQLSATEYGAFLANEPSPLSPSIFQSKAAAKLYNEFALIRQQATEPLSSFMDYISYSYMIDNVALIITGAVHSRDKSELLGRCHPLGWFDTLPALTVAEDIESLYSVVLVDTPLAPYFKDCLSADDLDDMNIEIIRNKLYKAYLEDFVEYISKKLDGPTKEIMLRFLEFEADKRTINIIINSFGTDLDVDEKLALLPNYGKLWPVASYQLVKSEDLEQVRTIVNSTGTYKGFLDNIGNTATSGAQGGFNDSVGTVKSLEDNFYEYEMNLSKLAFTQQFTYSTIWAWLKSREQEVRNITWIAECISQNQKDRIDNYISVY